MTYESPDIRYLRKWLNEDIDAPIDRQALARVLAGIGEAEYFPRRIMSVLEDIADRHGTDHEGPWHDDEGPMQDDADTAIAWIAAKSKQASQRQPIETCPKDGTPFLATDGTRYEVLNEPPGCALGVWTNINGRWAGSSVKHIRPTHWMPLPTAPKGDAS